MSDADSPPRNPLSRRGFLGGAAGLSALALACKLEKTGSGAAAGEAVDVTEWWRGGDYFVHDTVDTAGVERGKIRARVEGAWRELDLVDLPDRFVRWSFAERLERLVKLGRHGFSIEHLAGPHNACVATHGGPPRDGVVSLNTAYKGIGFVPRRERIRQTLAELQEAGQKIHAGHKDFRAGMMAKIRHLGGLYRDPARFDRRRKVSLELFTHRTHFTHTFLNMMVNPVASASFLAYPTFELRAIPQLLHPNNPKLTAHERDVVRYTNAVHDFVHGGTGDRIACLYHIISVYDDTPRPGAHGKRLA